MILIVQIMKICYVQCGSQPQDAYKSDCKLKTL